MHNTLVLAADVCEVVTSSWSFNLKYWSKVAEVLRSVEERASAIHDSQGAIWILRTITNFVPAFPMRKQAIRVANFVILVLDLPTTEGGNNRNRSTIAVNSKRRTSKDSCLVTSRADGQTEWSLHPIWVTNIFATNFSVDTNHVLHHYDATSGFINCKARKVEARLDQEAAESCFHTFLETIAFKHLSVWNAHEQLGEILEAINFLCAPVITDPEIVKTRTFTVEGDRSCVGIFTPATSQALKSRYIQGKDVVRIINSREVLTHPVILVTRKRVARISGWIRSVGAICLLLAFKNDLVTSGQEEHLEVEQLKKSQRSASAIFGLFTEPFQETWKVTEVLQAVRLGFQTPREKATLRKAGFATRRNFTIVAITGIRRKRITWLLSLRKEAEGLRSVVWMIHMIDLVEALAVRLNSGLEHVHEVLAITLFAHALVDHGVDNCGSVLTH